METPLWTAQDYERAWEYVYAHEEEVISSPIVHVDEGLTVILPHGLPALGVHFTGIFMAAPILLFIVILAFFPIMGFTTGWELSPNTLFVTAGCLVLIWGLVKILKLMLKNRDNFPRKYFVTLGRYGTAMHFSRLHFPHRDPDAFSSWKEIDSIKKCRTFFLPAILIGTFSVSSLKILTKKGKPLFIPLGLHEEQLLPVLTEIKNLINQKKST